MPSPIALPALGSPLRPNPRPRNPGTTVHHLTDRQGVTDLMTATTPPVGIPTAPRTDTGPTSDTLVDAWAPIVSDDQEGAQ
jgi:hypothetical protein